MKKVISIALVLLLISAVFGGCSGHVSKSKAKAIRSELEYYNEKALDNIDELMYTSLIYGEKWIKDTFSEDVLSYEPVVNDGTNLGYVTPSGNVIILFTKEEGRSDFIIRPYMEDLSFDWCSSDDIKEVKAYSKYIGASIDGAPHYGVLTIYGFNSSPELRFWYNMGKENSAYLDFVYGTAEFTLVDRD